MDNSTKKIMGISNFENVPVVWTPTETTGDTMKKLIKIIESKYRIKFNDYFDFHKWSTENLEEFWSELWEFSGVVCSQKFDRVIDTEIPMDLLPKWFEGAKLNFAENLLKHRDDGLALVLAGENKSIEKVTFRQMYEEAKLYAAAFRKCGLKRGDVVVCQISNRKEAIYAMQAVTSIGAVWTGALPQIGVQAVLNRFKQVNPKMFLTIDQVPIEGTSLKMLEKVQEIVEGLPSLEKVIIVPSKGYMPSKDISKIRNSLFLDDFLSLGKEWDGSVPEMEFEQVSCSHPVFINYTSGTTGLPKMLVHGSAALLTIYRDFVLHLNMKRGETWLLTSSVGWITWNASVCLLAAGIPIALYEGVPYYLSPTYFWDLIEELEISYLYLPSSTLDELEKRGYAPREDQNLEKLKGLIGCGSVVKLKTYDFVSQKIKKDVLFSSVYGMTELLIFGMICDQTVPIHKGEIPVPSLGCAFETIDASGNAIQGEIGDLVLSKPMPSLPLGLWNDPDDVFREKYFSQHQGKFCTGDCAYINPFTRGLVIKGRNDETLKQRGYRFGSVEIYHIVDTFPEVRDSICVALYYSDSEESAVLFLQMGYGYNFNGELVQKIRNTIARELTPGHVPDLILEVKGIPYNITGKKMEIIVKKIINKMPFNKETVMNPECLRFYDNLPELQIS